MVAEISVYALKVSIAQLLFYALYALFLRNDTWLQLKRFYLLMTLAFSFAFPFINFSFPSEVDIPVVHTLTEVVVSPFTTEPFEGSSSWHTWSVYVFVVGAAVMLCRLMWQIASIVRLRRSLPSHRQADCRLIFLPQGTLPFSFFRWIFISKSENYFSEVFCHELAHVRQWHSADVLLIHVATVLLWWNPVIYLWRKEMQINHENLADRSVLTSGCNAKTYQYILLQTYCRGQQMAVNNYFNVLQIKQRIAMMNKKSAWHTATKYLLAMPVAALLLLSNQLQASQNAIALTTNTLNITDDAVVKQTLEVTTEKASGKKSKMATWLEAPKFTVAPYEDGEPFEAVDEMPSFPGGVQMLSKYLARHLQYPPADAAKEREGRVVIGFTVDKQGNVINPVVKRGATSLMNEEALRVVSQMPKWNPGKHKGKVVDAYFSLPIVFKLKGFKK